MKGSWRMLLLVPLALAGCEGLADDPTTDPYADETVVSGAPQDVTFAGGAPFPGTSFAEPVAYWGVASGSGAPGSATAVQISTSPAICEESQAGERPGDTSSIFVWVESLDSSGIPKAVTAPGTYPVYGSGSSAFSGGSWNVFDPTCGEGQQMALFGSVTIASLQGSVLRGSFDFTMDVALLPNDLRGTDGTAVIQGEELSGSFVATKCPRLFQGSLSVCK